MVALYRALYRKWRPRKFADVVGQEAIVTALQNQIAAGRIGHAYLFTGTRGTGKTTCAKIFAKAVNCLDTTSPDPCGECAVCKGIDEGTILDVSEIDAASNNSVDDIRDLRDETAYLPAVCKYKVYIIDEVHMLSTSAFNALLKTMEEPPEHVIFILATTEVQKVPATILSRCQRYDFQRITADKIAGRLEYVAGQENIELDHNAAELIGRLADGAMRDALSILDTCAGVSNTVDEALVRRMAGVTDRKYLFEISDAIAARDAVKALQEIAALRQQSVDMRRLCMELAGHYRNLMLSALPGGTDLLTGTSPEEEAAYAARKDFPQAEAVRAVNAFGAALEKMARGTDQRIELELAVFSLTQPEAVPVALPAAVPARPVVTAASPAPFAAAPLPAAVPARPVVTAASPAPFAAAPQQVPPVQMASAPVPPVAAQPVPPTMEQPPFSAPIAGETPPFEPELAPAAPAVQQPTPAQQPVYAADVPIPKPVRTVAKEPQLFPQWQAVLELIAENDPMLNSYLRGTQAYYDGRRVLIECSDDFRDFMRRSKETSKNIKQYIYQVTHIKCGIGPYEKTVAAVSNAPAADVEETLRQMKDLGVDVVVEDK
ncbi:DNA polymerase III subunit gamma/tau [Gemmiger qucibialis]|uniref:DNA polymerase III subunit gamma/tau n=1 Tax=Gemmiger qucibialis TaxID=2997294 RepID=UPI0022E77A00|nr:DNA polymerase III subunit gamma/tau [Gemmiger qucibialis]